MTTATVEGIEAQIAKVRKAIDNDVDGIKREEELLTQLSHKMAEAKVQDHCSWALRFGRRRLQPPTDAAAPGGRGVSRKKDPGVVDAEFEEVRTVIAQGITATASISTFEQQQRRDTE